MLPNDAREVARLDALQRYDVLDSVAEAAFDDITSLAAQLCGTPISLISLVDGSRQWFKSRVGLDASQTSRETAFCAHAIHGRQVMVVPDAGGDPRFLHNPLVTGAPHIRFYAGAPLVTHDNHALGTLCVIDRQPRTLEPWQLEALQRLSRQVVALLELRRETRLREQITAIVGHDLKNPLTALQAGIYTLARCGTSGAIAERTLQRMKTSASRMSRMLSDLHGFTRAAYSNLPIQRTQTDLQTLAHHVVAEILDASPQRRIELRCDPPLEGRWDADRVAQAFSNLVANAVQHSPDDAPIQVRVWRDNQAAVFEVTNGGAPIPPHAQARLFEPYFRIEQGDSKHEGLGLGLYIVRGIAEAHGGFIAVRSSEAEGTTFSLRLPDVPADAEPQARAG